MYLIDITNYRLFKNAETRFNHTRAPVALIKFIDGIGGLARLSELPTYIGQKKFDAGKYEVRRRNCLNVMEMRNVAVMSKMP